MQQAEWGCLEVSVRCRINLSLFISFPSSLLLLAWGVDEIPTPTQRNADSRTLLILLPLPLTSCAPFAPSLPLDASHPILPWSPASVLLSVNLSVSLIAHADVIARLFSMFPPSFIPLLFGRASCAAVHSSSPLNPILTLLFPVFNPLTCAFSANIFFLNFKLYNILVALVCKEER